MVKWSRVEKVDTWRKCVAFLVCVNMLYDIKDLIVVQSRFLSILNVWSKRSNSTHPDSNHTNLFFSVPYIIYPIILYDLRRELILLLVIDPFQPLMLHPPSSTCRIFPTNDVPQSHRCSLSASRKSLATATLIPKASRVVIIFLGLLQAGTPYCKVCFLWRSREWRLS